MNLFAFSLTAFVLFHLSLGCSSNNSADGAATDEEGSGGSGGDSGNSTSGEMAGGGSDGTPVGAGAGGVAGSMGGGRAGTAGSVAPGGAGSSGPGIANPASGGDAWLDPYLQKFGIKTSCTAVAKAMGAAPLIDDFEDGNNALPTNEGRTGTWYAFDDGTGTTMPPSASFAPSADATRPPSTHALHFQGTAHTGWGGGVTTTFANQACYDASTYRGITFWGKGSGTVTVALQTHSTWPAQYGGKCVLQCSGFLKDLVLTSTWTQYTVRWSEMKLPSYVGTDVLKPDQIVGITLQATQSTSKTKSWDYWVDDVAFITE